MTSRELRRNRREQERKARKLAYRQSRAAAASTQETCGAGSLAGEPVADPALSFNPDLLDEFSADELAAMTALRARVHARASREALGPFSAGISDPPQPPAAHESRADPLVRKPVPRPASEPISGPTGPRTPEGKATSSGNSLKHGLASGRVIIPGEDPTQFEALLSDLINEHAPANETESLLVQQMAQSWWLMQRAIRIQNEAFTESRLDTHKLALFLRYQTTHERAFYRALNSLMKLQKERRRSNPEFVSQSQPPIPRENGFVSQNRPIHHFPTQFVSQTAVLSG